MQRNYTYDTLRTLATIFVVLLHLSATYVIKESKSHFGLHFFFANTIDSFTRVAVPLFVMLSGRFLFMKQFKIGEFYKKRASRILIPLLFWTIFYLFFTYFIRKNYQIDILLWRVVEGRPYYHLWYLYMLIGLYLCIPFLNKFYQRFSKKTLFYNAIFYLFIGLIFNIFEIYYNVKATFIIWFIPYLGYFILGYLLKDVKVNKRGMLIFYILSSLTIALLSYFTLGDYSNLFFYKYFSPFVIIASISFYSYFVQLKFKENKFSKISHLTFGIYLIHPMFEYLLNRGLKHHNLSIDNALFGILFKFVIVFGLSYLASLLLAKIKYLKNVI